ncbi:hypothetical protein FACS189431_5160 [Alphaproteobacteria bacterium]|nr:hypothetical protein FACS189431_5160 [Alphaproteobacteria bacterium]
MLIPVGTPFNDPGVVALEGENDISSTVVTKGSVNSNKIGLYVIAYSATNVDGFDKTISRDVFVYDPAVSTDISGKYAVDLDYSHRLQFSNGAIIKYADMQGMYGAGDFSTYSVSIDQLAPGIYSVSDLFGGYYVEGRAYAATYAMTGYISLNADNTLDVLSSIVAGWGDSLDALEDASYDPETGSIQWGAEYGGSYSFNVKLNKK